MSKQPTAEERITVAKALIPIALLWTDLMERHEFVPGQQTEIDINEIMGVLHRNNMYVRTTIERLGITDDEWEDIIKQFHKYGFSWATPEDLVKTIPWTGGDDGIQAK